MSVQPPASADTGDIDFGYTLNYTPTSGSSPTLIMLIFGAHIAVGDSPGDLAAPGINWGFGWGASPISGAPYHVNSPAIDGVKVSSQDNQLNLNGGYSQPSVVTRLSSGSGTLTTGSYVSDTLTLTAQGASPTTITGTVEFYWCYEPNITSVANAVPCLPVGSPASSPTVTTYSLLSTQSLTTANNNVISSPNLQVNNPGVYCFRALYISHIYPWQSTDSFQTTYQGQTNGGPECVAVVGASAVSLSSIKAQHNPAISPGRVTLDWTTASEVNTAGFNVHRSESAEGPYVQINPLLIPAMDLLAGGKYQYVDAAVVPGQTCYYQLEEVELNGMRTWYRPIRLTATESDQ
jgi:hypothetical protein